MSNDRVYPGIDHDEYGGMTDVGRIIRDAWVFGILPETERCENWSYDRINNIYDQVARAWEPYGHLASKLPPELRARHERIFAAAIARARELGWNVELGEDD